MSGDGCYAISLNAPPRCFGTPHKHGTALARIRRDSLAFAADSALANGADRFFVRSLVWDLRLRTQLVKPGQRQQGDG